MRKLMGIGLLVGIAGLGVAATPVGAINSYNAEPAPERTEVGAFVALWDNTGDGVPDPVRLGLQRHDDRRRHLSHGRPLHRRLAGRHAILRVARAGRADAAR